VIITGAQFLSDAWTGRSRLAALPDSVRPKTASEAYECQAELVDRLGVHYGGEIIGYKIACTNPVAQAQLNVPGPFYGRLISSFCSESPARLDASRFFMRVVEAEFAFRLARDLPPTAAEGGKRHAARSREELADAIEGVIPGIEIVDSRFHDWTTIGVLSLIADNACNAAWVRGPLLQDWRGIDLAAQEVRVMVNGELQREGSGSAVLGHPLKAFEWLVNTLSEQGVGLKEGQYITTGVTTEVYMAEPGDHITADFGAVGSAEVEFE
jgi:2-keto-4-pentenoate hydratase